MDTEYKMKSLIDYKLLYDNKLITYIECSAEEHLTLANKSENELPCDIFFKIETDTSGKQTKSFYRYHAENLTTKDLLLMSIACQNNENKVKQKNMYNWIKAIGIFVIVIPTVCSLIYLFTLIAQSF
ncbi:MAG: hypothetical protein R3Y23_00290 [Bacillota bacterium]